MTPAVEPSSAHRRRVIFLLLVALGALLYIQGPRLGDRFGVDEDFRTFYWMHRFQDPELFSSDPREGTTYVMVPAPTGEIPISLESPGYSLLFYAASFLFEPAIFVNLLSLLVLPITVWLLYRYGLLARGPSTALTLAIGFVFLNLASSSELSVATGLQRSFSCMLMIALIYALHRQKPVSAAIVVALSALIYAPVFLLAVATWGLYELNELRAVHFRLPVVGKALLPLLLATILGLAALSPVLLPRFSRALAEKAPRETEHEPESVAQDSYPHVWDNPTYGPGGRRPLFYTFPFIGRGGLVNKGVDAMNLVLLLVVGLLILLVLGRRALDLPFELWAMLGASLLAFALSWMGIWLTDSFLLYLPSRYTRVGLFLFLSIFVLLNLPDAIREAPAAILGNQKRLLWLVGGIELFAFALILLIPSEEAIFRGINMKWLLLPTSLILGILSIAVLRRRSLAPRRAHSGQGPRGLLVLALAAALALIAWALYAPANLDAARLNVPEAERKMLAFVGTLPKDALIAGTPCALDNVSLFSQRQAFFTCEKLDRNAKAIEEALAAYYAPDISQVLAFCNSYGVDFMVVDTSTYSQEFLNRGTPFFEPYNQAVLAQVSGQESFALAQVADGSKLFEAESLYVIPCDASAFSE